MVAGWTIRGVPILSPEWGGSPIAQRRKPWEHRQHQQPTAPNGATEFTGTSHSSARYGATQSKPFRNPPRLTPLGYAGCRPIRGFGGFAIRWLHSYFDGAQHERRAGFAVVSGQW